MATRMLARGYRAVRAPGLLGVYRLRRGSLSSDPLSMWEAALQVYAGLAEDANLPEQARTALRARLAEARVEHEALVHLLNSRNSYFGLRPHLVRLKHSLFRRRDWFSAPPAEISGVSPRPDSSVVRLEGHDRCRRERSRVTSSI